MIASMGGLAEQYGNEFAEGYEQSRRYSNELGDNLQQYLQQVNEKLQHTERQIKHQRKEWIQSLKNTDPVDGILCNKLFATLLWVAIMQFAYFVSSTIGSPVVNPLVALFIGGFWSFVLAYLALPSLTSWHLRNTTDSDVRARFKLLQLAVVEGLLIGFLFSNYRRMSIGPLAFLNSLVIGLAVQLLTGSSRIILLSASIGGGLAVQLGLGMLLGKLSVLYVFLALLYSGIGYCYVQLYFKYQSSIGYSLQLDHLFMLACFVAALYAEGLTLTLFGSSKNVHVR